ncbi:MAG: hypothetical protein LBS94_00905 [Prevotellaceae bacterium]|jgi:hypothetical protein|nr:hypothetical protein [Prevotellaceae bacterium]
MNTNTNNNLPEPVIEIDERLNAYENMVLFPEKVRQANDMLKNIGLPPMMMR